MKTPLRTAQSLTLLAAAAALAGTAHAATIGSTSFDVDPASTSIDTTGPGYLDWGYFLPNADFLDGTQPANTDFDALTAGNGAIDPATNSKASPGIGVVTITERDIAEYTNGNTGLAWSFTVNDGINPVSGTQNPLGAANGIAPNEDIFTITFNDLPVGNTLVTLYMDHTNNGRAFNATVDLSASDGNDADTLLSDTIGGNDGEGYFTFSVEVSSAVPDADLSISIDSVGGNFGQFQFAGYTVEVVSEAKSPTITSIEPVDGGSWELILEGDADTGYQFLSSPILDFDPGTLVENLSQGDPGDPGTIGGPADSTVTTDGTGLAKVRMTLAGSSNFVRAQIPPPPPPLLSEDFENNDGGFTVSTPSGTTSWAHGAPTSTDDGGTANPGGSVTAGNDGSTNCWGTDLGNPGYYANPTNTCLRSAVVDLTGVTAAELSFAQALDLDTGDSVTVNIIDDTTDTPIATDIITITDGDIEAADWEQVGPVAIPAAALGQPVRIEWCLNGTGGTSFDFMGWYIDDVLVSVPAP